MTDLTFAS